MSTIGSKFSINGVISTDKSVMQNITTLCNACGAWMTYDISEGKWAVVINAPGTSIASFNDSNIIGAIDISGKGINEMYNSVSVEFPHKDLRDQTDYVDLEIPTADYFPNELDNKLNMSFDIINDPVQAQYLGTIELKQSRVDKIIQFSTDYSKIGLKAGDLIDVTSAMLGYTNKIFRIIKIEEDDADILSLKITALEYDADVYSTDGLVRTQRDKKTGIVPKSANQAIGGNLNAPLYNTFVLTASPSLINSTFNAFAGDVPLGGDIFSPPPMGDLQYFNSGFSGNQNSILYLTFNLPTTYNTLQVNCQNPFGSFYYKCATFEGDTENRQMLFGFIPVIYRIYFGTPVKGRFLQEWSADWQTQNSIIILRNASSGSYTLTVEPANTYDLDHWSMLYNQRPNQIWGQNFNIAAQASGGGITVSVMGFKG